MVLPNSHISVSFFPLESLIHHKSIATGKRKTTHSRIIWDSQFGLEGFKIKRKQNCFCKEGK